MQARLCKALRIDVTILCHWYRNVAPSLPVSPQANFPFSRQAKFENSLVDIDFEYTGVLGDGEAHRKMLFVAKRSDNNEEVLVKFTHRYGSGVHQLLARNMLAPMLYDVRHKEEGSLFMVVMELIRGTHPIAIDNNNREELSKSIEQVTSILAKSNLVHGDLRAPNVHTTSTTTKGELPKFVVFDFDWAGKAGEMTYPDLLNPNEKWHQDADVGSAIAIEHDRYRMDQLLQN